MSFDLLNHLTPIASRGGGALGIGEEVAVRREPAQRLLVGAELDSQRHVGPTSADRRRHSLVSAGDLYARLNVDRAANDTLLLPIYEEGYLGTRTPNRITSRCCLRNVPGIEGYRFFESGH